MKKPTRTNVNGKRERRIAPRYRFKWSEEVSPAVKKMSAPETESLREDECYTRIEDAESARDGAGAELSVFAMEGFCAEQPWWAPFEFCDHSFQLDYKEDGKIREYELVFARAPTIPRGSDIWEPMLKTLLPSNKKAKRGVKRSGVRGALAAAGKKHPKQTDDKREFTSLRMLTAALVTVGEDWNHSLAQRLRPIRPKLLRNVVHMRRARANIVKSAITVRSALVQVSQNIASLASKVGNSLTRARDVAVRSFGSEAILEPRVVGHNIGFPLVLYSWRHNYEQAEGFLPKLWPVSWFGAIEWPVSWFGVLPPDEERVFV